MLRGVLELEAELEVEAIADAGSIPIATLSCILQLL